jgi:hypothetical protein
MLFLESYFLTYLLAYIYINNDKKFNLFTRIMSTINAFICIGVIIKTLLITGFWHYLPVYAKGDQTLITGLTLFYSYLFVDGLFSMFHFIKNISWSNFFTIVHHFIGGYGIYLMVRDEVGFGLGIYFAATEISTPLLNLSWFIYTNKSNSLKGNEGIIFISFYITFILSRILTIPILCYYIFYNYTLINSFDWLLYIMLYTGSGCLVMLNITWTVMLTKKLF